MPVEPDPAFTELEQAFLPAIGTIHRNKIRYTDAARLFRRLVFLDTLKRERNMHRASLTLDVSRSWMKRVVEEGEGTDPIHLKKKKAERV